MQASWISLSTSVSGIVAHKHCLSSLSGPFSSGLTIPAPSPSTGGKILNGVLEQSSADPRPAQPQPRPLRMLRGKEKPFGMRHQSQDAA